MAQWEKERREGLCPRKAENAQKVIVMGRTTEAWGDNGTRTGRWGKSGLLHREGSSLGRSQVRGLYTSTRMISIAHVSERVVTRSDDIRQ